MEAYALADKKVDRNHIKVAKLDVVLKDISLALRWGLREIAIRTDPAIVLRCVTSVFTFEKRTEMFTKRYLGSEVLHLNSKLCVIFVPSEKNKVNSFSKSRKT